MVSAVIAGTNSVTGEASNALTVSYTVQSPPTGGVIVGATTGQGAGNAHATPDLAGWQSFQAKTGTFAACTKLFDVGAGYPNLPSSWSGVAPSLAANNGGHPVMILYAFNNVPTPAQFVTLFRSLPAGQRLGFVYQSEAENSGSGINGAAFVANEHTISGNLNAALATMGGGPFWTRANFPNINSAYMAFYQTSPGSIAYIPAPGDVDAYGADLYHKGPLTDNVASSDPRYQGYVKAVKAKAGANVAYAFPEYGIDVSNITDAQRANILAGDFAYMTGPSAPGSGGLLLLNYWYEIGNSGQQYPFVLPSATATEWQAISS